MMKTFFTTKFLLNLLSLLMLGLTALSPAQAENEVKLAVHIQSQEYIHPVRIWNFTEGLWIDQGTHVENAAKQVYSQLGEKGFAMCDSKIDAANLLVWLRPNLHFNPQVNTFFGKVTGYFYTADGKPLVKLNGEARLVGRMLGEQTNVLVGQLYQQAVQDLYQQMVKNQTLNDYLNGNVKGMVTLNPCATAEFLPVSKFRFTSFQ
jgi:hypothetical protein